MTEENLRFNDLDSGDVKQGPDSRGNFIRDIIKEDLRTGRVDTVVVRFPPEPNGFLHIGHAKAIALNYGLARDFDGEFHLRFDDTNPETEDMAYVAAIERDLKWLGVEWGEHRYFASDYFEQLYEWAQLMIKKGLAYVDDLSEEEIRAFRGTVTEPGRPSRCRERSVEENLALLEQMKSGSFRDGEKVLRAKIDLSSPNMKMRDPLMYRIRNARHYRRGSSWCIYPMYDWAHGQSDAIEGITHSICTLEFENNRELYDWFLNALDLDARPRQFEFARLNISYMVMSKRKLLDLVRSKLVSGWDDPRMPTIAGFRRRGVTPEAILSFAEAVGITRVDSCVDIEMFEHAIRDDLNFRAPRVMCVLQPQKVVIMNLEAEEWLEASYWPHDVPRQGSRKVPFTREIYIERDDFMESPPRRFHRLSPGAEVRLRYGYIIRCDTVVKDAEGNVVELHCTYDPDTRSGGPAGGRKVKGTIHWVSASHALPAEVRLYDRLFNQPDPGAGDEDIKNQLNPGSLDVRQGCVIEPSIAKDPADTRYQFERNGFFWQDPVDSSSDHLVFNRIISLRDTWSKTSERSEKNKAVTQNAGDGTGVVSNPGQPPQAAPEDLLGTVQRARFEQYVGLGLNREEAVVIAGNDEMTQFFEQSVQAGAAPVSTGRWVVNELPGAMRAQGLDQYSIRPEAFARLMKMVEDGVISGRVAKDVLAKMLVSSRDPQDIVDEEGLAQVSDASALAKLIDSVIAAHPEKVRAYRGGKTGLMGFFVGRVMQESRGTANPEMAKALLEDKLAG